MAKSGIIFDIKQFAIHDGPGIRTTVFFKGCPMDCSWCHNPESRLGSIQTFTLNKQLPNDNTTIQLDKTVGYEITSEDILKRILKDEIFYDESCGGVTFSGGEPFYQTDFLFECLKLCKSEGLHTVVDTCGYTNWDNIEKVISLVDIFFFDLKPMDDSIHMEYTKTSNKLIHENLKKLASLNKEIVIRFPLIPNLTNIEENLLKVIELLKPLKNIRRIDLLPFNKLGNDKIERYQLDRDKLDWTYLSEEEIKKVVTFFKNSEYDVRIGT